MSFATFYGNLKRTLQDRFPSTKDLLVNFELDRLFSPHHIKLPKVILEKAAAAVSAHYRIVQSQSLQNELVENQPWLKKVKASADSALTAYDFHTNENGDLALIEINTNASSYMLSLGLYLAHGEEPQMLGVSAEESLKSVFKRDRDARTLVIVDDQVEEQKMFIEFLMYKDWLEKMGWQVDICEAESLVFSATPEPKLTNSLFEKIDFVYNRTTDFYFEKSEHEALKSAYIAKCAQISPHPWAYLLLADKERLVDMRTESDLEAISKVLLPTYEIEELGGAEAVWQKRKNLFFKPRNSFGGKSVYRGSSVSKKVFERIVAEKFLAQDFMPAQSYPVKDSDSYLENWKFDLRFFVYKDQIQMAVARLYQGQVTNFSSQYGGLTAVHFTN